MKCEVTPSMSNDWKQEHLWELHSWNQICRISSIWYESIKM